MKRKYKNMKDDKIKKQQRRYSMLILKVMGAVLAAVVVAMACVLVYANVKHKNALKEEEKYLTPPGQMVEVNGHEIHVVHRGDESAKHAIVFIHSNKTVDDSIALEPLWDELSDYEIIYVDRSGVGYSEDWDAPKDIESMLEETRSAVKAVTNRKTYILAAIQSGGMLALDWADTYPDEVESIIGLQMYLPEQYTNLDDNAYCSLSNKIMLKLVNIGGQRLSDSVFPDNDYNLYSKDQMDRRDALIAKNLYTQGMYNEDKNLVKNGKKVNEAGWPEAVKMYLIYCNPYEDPYLHENEDALEMYEEVASQSDADPADTYNTNYRESLKAHSNVTVDEISGPDRLIVYNPQKTAQMIQEYTNGRN